MKRTALTILILGLALVVTPAAMALQMDVGSSSGYSKAAVPIQPDILGGDGGLNSVVLRADILSGDGGANAVTLRPDVLGGDGGASIPELPVSSTSSHDWDVALISSVSFLAVLLLGTAAIATTRRRHRLSF